jgi:hypothetical protein
MPADKAKSENQRHGFIYLCRKLQSWRWKQKPNMVAIWMDLLLRAQYHKTDFEDQQLEVGQCIVSIPGLSRTCGLTSSEVRTCLARLKSTGEITCKTTNKFSIVTISNYKDFQDFERRKQQTKQQAAPQSSHSQATVKSQADRNIQEREVRKERKGGKPPAEKLIEPVKPEDPVVEITNGVSMRKSEADRIVKHIGREAFWFYAKKLSDTCARDGKIYKDYAAAMRNWIRDDIVKGWGWYTNHPKPANGYKDANQRPKPKLAVRPPPEIENAAKMNPEEVRGLILQKFPHMKFDDSQTEQTSAKVTP